MTTKKQIQQIIESTKGSFFSITYIKANGEERKACAKNKAIAALVGGKSTHENSNSVPYWDVNKKAYRAFNVDRLKQIKCGAKEYNF